MVSVLAVAMFAWTVAAARATDVEVHVQPVDGRGGLVRVGVCTEAEFLKGCSRRASAPAHPGEVTVLVPDVPPGVYAVTAFHDVSGADAITRNVLGIPTEGVGFSRDPALLFGPPSFADTALRIAGPRVRADVRLKFEP